MKTENQFNLNWNFWIRLDWIWF